MFQRKIWLIFLLVLMAGIAVSARIVYLGDSVQDVNHAFLAEKLPYAQHIGDLRGAISDEERLLYEYYSYTASRETFQLQRTQNKARVDDIVAQLEREMTSADEISMLRTRLVEFEQLSDELAGELGSRDADWDKARAILAKVKPNVRNIESALARISLTNQQSVNHLGKDAQNSIATMVNSVIGFSVLIFGIALFVSYYVVAVLREGIERRRLALFAERDPNPVLRLNAAGEILYANPATDMLMAQLGFDHTQMAKLLPADLQVYLAETQIAPDSSTQFESMNGSHTLEFTVAHLPDFSEFHIYIKDISARKNAEAALRAHRDDLEKQVELRTRDLEIARDGALQASQTKSAFIANMSHEIRTPLTPIIGFAESMLSDEQDHNTRKSLLASIVINARHLLNIINEILDLSKIEANRLDVEKIQVDTLQIMQEIDAIAGMLAREKGLQFSIKVASEIPRKIYSDPTRIKQILLNLVTNALKFTEKGNVDVLFSFNPMTSQMELTVSDTGIGIPQDKLERLFKAFSQADSSTTRRFGGTGLGLYISQRLAVLLGGDIKVESIEGEGSKFKVTLDAGPIDPQDMVTETTRQQTANTAPPSFTLDRKLSGSVLVAEDSPDNQKLISYYIRKTGAEPTMVDNGQLAVEEALSSDYDLILMDMQMPVMGGLEAIELLRATGCTTPIYALTANAMREDRETYQRVGCNGFLAKPIELEPFSQVLATHLKAAGTQTHTNDTRQDEEFRSLTSAFIQSLPNYADSLQHAMENAEYTKISELAHQLKGVGGSFGFHDITQLATTLEHEAKTGEHDKLSELVQQLCQLLDSTLYHADPLCGI